MKHKAFLLLLLFLSLSSFAQGNAAAFAKSVVEEYKKASSVSYDIDYRMKFFDYDDTTAVSGRCYLIRDVKDELNGGKVWFDSKDEEGDFSTYYNLDKIYYIEYHKKEILVFDPKQEEMGPLGSTHANMKNVFFMKPDKLLEYVTAYPTVMTDTMIGASAYKALKIDWPGDEEIKSRRFNILINQNSRQIEQIKYWVSIMEGTELQTQYNEWNLRNISFNAVTSGQLDEKLAALKGYTKTDFEYKEQERQKPLEAGTPAPEINASLYTDGSAISLQQYRGKIVLLDFWFIGCQPCVMAIPGLNRLQEKYKDDIIVIGLNPVNLEEKQLKKVPDYIARNQVKYTMAKGERSVPEAYHVDGYPTLYVIDQNGIIRGVHNGYSDDYDLKIEEEIEKLLKKNKK